MKKTRYYAAIEIVQTGERLIVRCSRANISHPDVDSAMRALERMSENLGINAQLRGLVWSTNYPSAVADGDWTKIETVAL